jgi:hypothetical protein
LRTVEFNGLDLDIIENNSLVKKDQIVRIARMQVNVLGVLFRRIEDANKQLEEVDLLFRFDERFLLSASLCEAIKREI